MSIAMSAAMHTPVLRRRVPEAHPQTGAAPYDALRRILPQSMLSLPRRIPVNCPMRGRLSSVINAYVKIGVLS
eukprot:scaffold360_cov334-Prasinococcus_capsulatus_cf.AAC.7